MGTQHQYQPLVQGQLAVRKVCWLQCSYHITSYYHKFNLSCLIFGLNILRPYYFSQVYSSLLQMNFATVLFIYKVTMVCYVCNHSMITLCIPNLYFSYLMRFCGQFCCNIFFGSTLSKHVSTKQVHLPILGISMLETQDM